MIANNLLAASLALATSQLDFQSNGFRSSTHKGCGKKKRKSRKAERQARKAGRNRR